jgi:hypothetical protein
MARRRGQTLHAVLRAHRQNVESCGARTAETTRREHRTARRSSLTLLQRHRLLPRVQNTLFWGCTCARAFFIVFGRRDVYRMLSQDAPLKITGGFRVNPAPFLLLPLSPLSLVGRVIWPHGPGIARLTAYFGATCVSALSFDLDSMAQIPCPREDSRLCFDVTNNIGDAGATSRLG